MFHRKPEPVKVVVEEVKKPPEHRHTWTIVGYRTREGVVISHEEMTEEEKQYRASNWGVTRSFMDYEHTRLLKRCECGALITEVIWGAWTADELGL